MMRRKGLWKKRSRMKRKKDKIQTDYIGENCFK